KRMMPTISAAQRWVMISVSRTPDFGAGMRDKLHHPGRLRSQHQSTRDILPAHPKPHRRMIRRIAIALLLASSAAAQTAQTAPTSVLKWRNIGPHRGGRVRAMAGVPQQPYTFYFAQVNGGVFKTDDAGRTWTPIFDSQ